MTPRGGNYGKSPLARVNEEGLPLAPRPIRTAGLVNKDPSAPASAASERGSKKLVEVETPRSNDEKKNFFKGPVVESALANDTQQRKGSLQGLGVRGVDGISQKNGLAGDGSEMRSVQI